VRFFNLIYALSAHYDVFMTFETQSGPTQKPPQKMEDIAMANLDYNRIYICGRQAYDNELAMYRHEGASCKADCAFENVFDPHPRFAYRIEDGNDVRWATDPVDVYRTRWHSPEASIEMIEVLR